MPKKPIDYSKTIMYHFVCEDSTITNEYVGHTTEWYCRKRDHKTSLNNINSKSYNEKKYKIIRENGGWENWRMVPLEEYPCENEIQARIREEYWRKELKADMNSQRAYRTPEEKKEQAYQSFLNNKEKINKKRVEKYKNDTEYREIKKQIQRNKNKINKEKIKLHNKEYREKNKENMDKKMKEYREKNKDIINEKRRNKPQEIKDDLAYLSRWKRAMKEQESTFYLSCVQKLLF
jgi:hypothetical protein